MRASQNSADPHSEQKLRCTFSDERYQLTLSPPCTDRSRRRTLTPTKTWLVCFLQCEQWQASGCFSSLPATSKRTPPHRQDPLIMAKVPMAARDTASSRHPDEQRISFCLWTCSGLPRRERGPSTPSRRS